MKAVLKEIALQDKKVSYTLRKSRRARRMRLAVHCDGSVVLTAPAGLKENIAEQFIREKASWLFSKIHFFSQFRGSPIARYGREDYLKHKGAAAALVTEKIERFSKAYGFHYRRISVKNQKTRWGSCSRKGNLNFNYKIIFLPEKVQDYVVVHELCHRGEFNHSKKFWALVARTVPDHAAIRKELKQGGMNFY